MKVDITDIHRNGDYTFVAMTIAYHGVTLSVQSLMWMDEKRTPEDYSQDELCALATRMIHRALSDYGFNVTLA